MKLVKNPLFYLCAFLILVLGFKIGGVVFGAGSSWSPPAVPPTGGQPFAPVDIGTTPQIKKSMFSATSLQAGEDNVLGNRIILDPLIGGIKFGDSSSFKGAIRFNGTTLQYNNTYPADTWKDLGTGGGGGDYCSGSKFNGVTTVIQSTNITSGGKSGYAGAKDLCNIAFSGSHVCAPEEILRTVNCEPEKLLENAKYTNAGGVPRRFWIQGGPPGFTAQANDCKGWTTDSGNAFGRFWSPLKGTEPSAAHLENCQSGSSDDVLRKPLGCCI